MLLLSMRGFDTKKKQSKNPVANQFKFISFVSNPLDIDFQCIEYLLCLGCVQTPLFCSNQSMVTPILFVLCIFFNLRHNC